MNAKNDLFQFKLLNEDEYDKFYYSLYYAKENNAHGCFVSLKEMDHYKNTANFVYGDQVAGFSIEPDGDLCGVHKNPAKDKENKFMQSIIICALNNGAKKLDCYGEALERIYLAHGFIPVGSTKFIAEANPEFDVATFGSPQIFAMVKGVKNAEDLVYRQSADKLIKLEDINKNLREFEDYDSLLRFRDDILHTIEIHNFNYDQSVNLVQGKRLR